MGDLPATLGRRLGRLTRNRLSMRHVIQLQRNKSHPNLQYKH